MVPGHPQPIHLERITEYPLSSHFATRRAPRPASASIMRVRVLIALAIFIVCDSFQPSRLRKSLTAATLGISFLGWCGDTSWTCRADEQVKLRSMPADRIAKIVEEDITVRQALITADFTREIYDESCTFKDEVDTYPINKYIVGTKALFVPEKSKVQLTSPVEVTDEKIAFKFKETLTFNIPILSPSVDLQGNVELFRGPDGLISRSVEHWDSPPLQVISKARYFQ